MNILKEEVKLSKYLFDLFIKSKNNKLLKKFIFSDIINIFALILIALVVLPIIFFVAKSNPLLMFFAIGGAFISVTILLLGYSRIEYFKDFVRNNNISTKDFFTPLLNKNNYEKNKELFDGIYSRLEYLLNNVSEVERQNFQETSCLLESFLVLEEVCLYQEQKKQQYKEMKNISFKPNTKKTLELKKKMEILGLNKRDLLKVEKLLK